MKLSQIQINDEIARRAKVIAAKLGVEVDEASQEMHLAVLLRDRQDPTFLNQTVSFVGQYAEWKLRSYLAKGQTDDNQVHIVDEAEAEAGEPGLMAELLPSQNDTERAAIFNVWVEQALTTLPEIVAQAMVLLMAGYQKQEVARQVGRSNAWITNVALPHIKRALA